jgi:formamidopyrimidine-DNA glycosylase
MPRMPELPDVCVYVEALERRLAGERLEGARIASPFVLRTHDPPVDALVGRSRTPALEAIGAEARP